MIPPVTPPSRRYLKVYAFDPLASQAATPELGNASENEVVLDVEYEPLEPGPVGQRLAVLDYDGARDRYYAPVDLEDRAILSQDGITPNEADPRFHQQMTYAVAMKTIENFDRALGRRIRFTNRRGGPFRDFGDRLCIIPHAFEEANAYFEPIANAVVFGYFTAEAEEGSAFVPGQTVFTCLSSDVIAHETTHALVHRLRPRFMEPTNADVGAFHEGFSDIVAIFQHFTYPEMLRNAIARTRGALDQPGLFVDLAQQFGHGGGDGQALRTAISAPDPSLYAKTEEEHDRGALLLAAVFDAFFAAYRQRTEDLTGDPRDRRPLSPGAVQRIARDAELTAQQFLTMCIRAFEYLPPVDITFGDFLRAAITADAEINGAATRRNRDLLVEGFRRRGIYPEGVTSLSDLSLRWEPSDGSLPPLPNALAADLLLTAKEVERGGRPRTASSSFAAALGKYASDNAARLGFARGDPIATKGFHSSFHVSSDGQLRAELVATFEQTSADEADADLPVRAATTVIAGADGVVRYVISKPSTRADRADWKAAAAQRRERTRSFMQQMDERDPGLAWMTDQQYRARMSQRMQFSRFHAARRP